MDWLVPLLLVSPVCSLEELEVFESEDAAVEEDVEDWDEEGSLEDAFEELLEEVAGFEAQDAKSILAARIDRGIRDFVFIKEPPMAIS